jgi:hypothetical protein
LIPNQKAPATEAYCPSFTHFSAIFCDVYSLLHALYSK